MVMQHPRQRQGLVAPCPISPVIVSLNLISGVELARGIGLKDEQASTPRQFLSPGYVDTWYPAASPTRPIGFSTGGRYVSQPFGLTGHLGYDTLQSPPVVDNELSHTFRGMVVEEDYNLGHLPLSMPGPAPNPQQRPPNLQPRTPYNIYPQADYAHYYNSVVRERYVDHAYGYDPYHSGPDRLVYVNPRGMSGASPPTLYPNFPSAEFHRQQRGMFFDYGLTVRAPVSQFYYPFHQHLLYLPPPHSPMHTPQLAVAPPNLTDKEPEFQVSTLPLPPPPQFTEA